MYGKGAGLESKAKQSLSHPHDLLVRGFLGDRDLAANFFINYLSLEWARAIDYDSMKREPSDSINRDFAELIGDLLYSAKFKGTGQDLRVFMLLEHQSRPDRFMSFRLLKYVCAAYQQYYSANGKKNGMKFPYPLAVVLHHGKTPWKEVTPMRALVDIAPEAPADILKFPVCLVDLARIPNDSLAGHPAVRALLDSLQSASTGRLEGRFENIIAGLSDVRDDSRLDFWSESLSMYMMNQCSPRNGLELIRNAFRRIHTKKEADKMTLTLAEKLRREGRFEGRAEGRSEGRAEGKIETILAVLESRFNKVPAGLKKKLLSMRDPERIDKAIKLAAVCKDLKELQKDI